MDILRDAMMKDEHFFFNINQHYTEFRVIHHPYVRLSRDIPHLYVTVFKRFMTQKPHVTPSKKEMTSSDFGQVT